MGLSLEVNGSGKSQTKVIAPLISVPAASLRLQRFAAETERSQKKAPDAQTAPFSALPRRPGSPHQPGGAARAHRPYAGGARPDNLAGGRGHRFSGPDRGLFPGGRELRERLKNCLLLEESSLTTWDSACHTLPLLLDLEIAAVGLISDALHLRRAHFLFRRHYRHHPISLHPLPVPGVIRHYWRHRRFLWLTRMILRETGAWVKFLVRIARDRQR